MRRTYTLSEAQADNRLIELITTCLIQKRYRYAYYSTRQLAKYAQVRLDGIERAVKRHDNTRAITELTDLSSDLTNYACVQNGGSKWQ